MEMINAKTRIHRPTTVGLSSPLMQMGMTLSEPQAIVFGEKVALEPGTPSLEPGIPAEPRMNEPGTLQLEPGIRPKVLP